jgi:alginate O-acetyltransferase complex protein AlgI
MFHSGSFWIVMAVAAVVYWLLPVRFRLGFLGAVSIAYIIAISPVTALVLLGWSLGFFYLSPLATPRRAGAPSLRQAAGEMSIPLRAQQSDKDSGIASTGTDTGILSAEDVSIDRRCILWGLIGGILLYLGAFKYLIPNIQFFQRRGGGGLAYFLPLGISYYSFKFIHYAVEVTRGRIVDRSLSGFLCYIYMLPTFSAGPIERYDHFISNLDDRWSAQGAAEGLGRIIQGLIKRFVLSEMVLREAFNFAASGTLLKRLDVLSTFQVWGYAIALYLYVYVDFAGYSDLAIGSSRLFGIRIMENFQFPILAPNIGEFWKRWHMTLSGWCQTYVYMPLLGLTRRPNLATYGAFLAIGMWHSASPPWLLWGLYHGTGIVVYQTWARTRRRQKWVWTNGWAWWLAGIAMTTLFVAAGDLLCFAGARSARQAITLIAKLLFIRF